MSEARLLSIKALDLITRSDKVLLSFFIQGSSVAATGVCIYARFNVIDLLH